MLSKEEIWKAMKLPGRRTTTAGKLDTIITAEKLRRTAANLGVNRAELLTRYRLIRPRRSNVAG